MARAPRLISWKSGRNFTAWHIDLGAKWEPLCKAIIPDGARRCDSRSWETIRKLNHLCENCLKAFSESETA